MNFRTALVAALASVALMGAANAAPITGQISLAGYVSAYGSTDLAVATGLNFQTSGASADNGSAPGGLTSFGGGYGSFAGLACGSVTGSCGVIQDIQSFTTQGAMTSFLTLATNGISFDLTSIGSITRTGAGSATGGSITITANGTIHETGYDNTTGVFILTAQGNNIVSFSATTLASAAAVPEPASLAILGGSLAALGMIRRKKA